MILMPIVMLRAAGVHHPVVGPWHLLILNDVDPTYLGLEEAHSMLDFTLATLHLDVYWSLEFDTRGSNNPPILLRINHFGVLPRRVHETTNWNVFPKPLNTCNFSVVLLHALFHCLNHVTTEISCSIPYPRPCSS